MDSGHRKGHNWKLLITAHSSVLNINVVFTPLISAASTHVSLLDDSWGNTYPKLHRIKIETVHIETELDMEWRQPKRKMYVCFRKQSWRGAIQSGRNPDSGWCWVHFSKEGDMGRKALTHHKCVLLMTSSLTGACWELTQQSYVCPGDHTWLIWSGGQHWLTGRLLVVLILSVEIRVWIALTKPTLKKFCGFFFSFQGRLDLFLMHFFKVQ